MLPVIVAAVVSTVIDTAGDAPALWLPAIFLTLTVREWEPAASETLVNE